MAWLVDKRRPEWLRTLGKRLATKKVDLSRRVIRRANRKARVERHFSVMEKPEVVAAIQDCDFIFLAADGHRDRRLFNALVHPYLIPGVPMGTRIHVDPDRGAVIDVRTTTRPVKNGRESFRERGSQSVSYPV